MRLFEKVSGVYHGNPFTGSISAERSIESRVVCQEIKIVLDKPISVYGGKRDSILLYDNPKYIGTEVVACTIGGKNWY
jgi:hypothetical protein